MTCEEMIHSEDYMDILIPQGQITAPSNSCRQKLGSLYDVLHVPYGPRFFESPYAFSYYLIPKLFGLLDVQSLEASGILAVRRQPVLNLTGEGVIIGFLDTGIEFAADIFRRPNGGTRVVGIWDQTVRGEGIRPPKTLLYGREYTERELDEAVRTQNPYEQIYSRDENGHGTYIASLAAGNEAEDGSFSGAAPEAEIAMVKLKPAKKSIRDYYMIKEEAVAYQENDMIAGIRYLENLAFERKKPLVLCLALGTSQGSHNGNLPLAQTLSAAGSISGSLVVVGMGNETARAHHYSGKFEKGEERQTVEIRVGSEEANRGFTTELWGFSPDLYSLALRSPGGEYISRVSVRPGKKEVINFVLEGTTVELSYRFVVQESGEFLAMLRFIRPAAGVWTIEVYNDIDFFGTYNMWLPIEPFISAETVFLNPSPNTTLTSPADADNIISVAAYQYRDNSIFLHSGRGYRADGLVRPDLAAPGVDIEGYIPAPGNTIRKTTRSGSSAATAIMAGAAALLLQWAIVRQVRPILTSQDARAFFVRGAERNPSIVYPNREWGYGTLDMYGVFEEIRSQIR